MVTLALHSRISLRHLASPASIPLRGLGPRTACRRRALETVKKVVTGHQVGILYSKISVSPGMIEIITRTAWLVRV